MKQPFYVQIGAVYSPHLFQKRVNTTDVAAPSSSQYIELGWGNKYRTIGQYGNANCAFIRLQKPGEFKFYLKYRFTVNYHDFFGAHDTNGHEAAIGVGIQDIRETDPKKQQCPAGTSGALSSPPMFNYELRGELVHDWTSDPAKENTTYTARAEILSRPLAYGIKLFGRGRIDRTVYTYTIAPAVMARHDWRYRLGGGVNLNTLVKKFGGFTLEIEAREEWRRSNDLTQNRNQFQLLATLDLDFD